MKFKNLMVDKSEIRKVDLLLDFLKLFKMAICNESASYSKSELKFIPHRKSVLQKGLPLKLKTPI